ncbi:MAG: glycosyltransferase family 4 protein [Planctomycetota bacterium]|nr:glycosyltransferase family 4 protein [Planctomycetota bacterium]
MNILYACAVDLSQQFAGTTHVLETVNGLRRRGHRVLLVSTKHGRSETTAPGHRDSFRLPVPQVPVLRPLVFHVLLFVYIVCVTLRHRIHVIYEREIPFGFGLRIAALLMQIPRVVEVNGLPGDEENAPVQRKLRDKLRAIFQRIDLRAASAVVTVTARMKRVLIECYSLRPERVAVVQNGANDTLFRPLDKFRCRSETGLSHARKYICYVGSFFRYHAIENIVKAAPAVIAGRPEVVFLLVGDGQERRRCEEMVKVAKLGEHFLFTGARPYETIPKYICASDLCLFMYRPGSPRQSVSPLKVFEYLACERPVLVLANDCDMLGTAAEAAGSPPFLHHDDVGPPLVARGILAALSDPEILEETARRGREFVLQHHTWARVAQDIEFVLLGTRAGRKARHSVHVGPRPKAEAAAVLR